MGDKEYLYELAHILESAKNGEDIRIQAATAQDIATRLRLIASRINTIH